MHFPLRLLAAVGLALASACVGSIGDTNNGSASVSGAADEIFPPALLEPYDGPSLTTYDNTFISYEQLRGKVSVIFDDNWVRDDIDLFATNIVPLGGADFRTTFVEARAASADFLLTLDAMSKDVCATAANKASGPFTGLNLTQELTDIPAQSQTTYSAVDASQTSFTTLPAGCGIHGSEVNFCTNGTLSITGSPFAMAERYRITTRARATGAGVVMQLKVNGTLVEDFNDIAATATDYSYEVSVNAGDEVSVVFANDGTDANGVDMNLIVTSITIVGPLSGSTGTTRRDAAYTNLTQLYQKILFRKPTDQELSDTYALAQDVANITSNNLKSAWSGVCEVLTRHPDFVFTLPPSRTTADASDKDTLLLVKLAADLVDRAPTSAEVNAIANKRTTIDEQIDTYLASDEFRATMMHNFRVRTQSDGSEASDEPARLWTYLLTSGASFEELLTGAYAVDTNFQPQAREEYHGKTGVLTMKGYIAGKQGLPHYNYPARVLTDFMGYVFEVPPEIVQMRLGSTPSGTVDPTSLCFQCHALLTPLAYQRRRWTDDGDYVPNDANGALIDQTDDGIVENYPFAGDGMEAFAIQAVHKEKFIRHTINAEFDMVLRRLMRADDDERVIYKQLYDTLKQTGDLRATLKVILASPQYRGEQS